MSKIKVSIVEKLYQYLYDHNMGKFRNLEGKLLTLTDATFQDPEQRKAQKDVIKNIIWDIRKNDLARSNWVLKDLARIIGDSEYLKHLNERDMVNMESKSEQVNYFED